MLCRRRRCSLPAHRFGLAYAHMVEPRSDDLMEHGSVAPRGDSLAPFRRVFSGPLIAAGGYKGQDAAAAVAAGAGAPRRTPVCMLPLSRPPAQPLLLLMFSVCNAM
jgi:hypothetical protein